MHKILLVIPPANTVSHTPYLGISYIASALIKNGIDSGILNLSVYKGTPMDAALKILAEEPVIVGLSVFTPSYGKIKGIIAQLKDLKPDVNIVIGGPHISALPEFALADLGADIGIIGEAEEVFVDMVKSYGYNLKENDLSGYPGVVFKKNNEIIRTEGINIIKDLDSLETPAWQLIDPASYIDTPGHIFGLRHPAAPVITSRGCPHNCSFCCSQAVHGRKIRLRSADAVVNEIECLIKDFGIKEINIIDDNFTEVRGHAIAICTEIIKRGLDITWKTPVGVRLDSLDDELLSVMKQAGCYQLGFGIESVSSEVLEKNQKPLSASTVLKKIEMVKRHGFETFGFFILGLPNDTRQTLELTVEFARRSPLDYVVFSFAVPYPGSELFQRLYLHGEINDILWESFVFTNPFDTCMVKKDALRRIFVRAFISSYIYNPKRLFKIIKHIKLKHLPKLLRVIKVYFSRTIFKPEVA